MRSEQLDYHLPPDRIATSAAEPRDAARLMFCDRGTGEVSHHRVSDLPELARVTGGFPGPGDLMLVNQSKVVPARFFARRRQTGGKVEGLFLAEESPAGLASGKGPDPAASASVLRWRCVFETRGKPAGGERMDLCDERGHDAGVALVLLEPVAGGEWRCAVEPAAEAGGVSTC